MLRDTTNGLEGASIAHQTRHPSWHKVCASRTHWGWRARYWLAGVGRTMPAALSSLELYFRNELALARLPHRVAWQRLVYSALDALDLPPISSTLVRHDASTHVSLLESKGLLAVRTGEFQSLRWLRYASSHWITACEVGAKHIEHHDGTSSHWSSPYNGERSRRTICGGKVSVWKTRVGFSPLCRAFRRAGQGFVQTEYSCTYLRRES